MPLTVLLGCLRTEERLAEVAEVVEASVLELELELE
jgi:hypothetical protein